MRAVAVFPYSRELKLMAVDEPQIARLARGATAYERWYDRARAKVGLSRILERLLWAARVVLRPESGERAHALYEQAHEQVALLLARRVLGALSGSAPSAGKHSIGDDCV